MLKSTISKFVVPFVSVLVGVALFAPPVLALDIQVAPSTLVISSNGGQLTVHTDVPFVFTESVVLIVDGTSVPCSCFADNCGDLVAQCSRDVAVGAIGEFSGDRTTVVVTLVVDGVSASRSLSVKR